MTSGSEATRAALPIRHAQFPADTAALVAVIREYVDWLGIDLSYRGFEDEMASFEATYTPPSGLFCVAMDGGEIAGCAGLLRHTDETAELKRVFVREPWRGLALGEKLVRSVIDTARASGYAQLILDSVPQTWFAQRLYVRLGFVETAPYYDNPLEGTRFFALAL